MKFVNLFSSLTAVLALPTPTAARPAIPDTSPNPDDLANLTASHKLHPRWDNPHPATNDDWYRAVCRGRTLLDAVRETDWEAAHRFKPPPPHMTVHSPFREFPKAFSDWGWFFYNGAEVNSQNGRFDHSGWGIDDALKGMKVSDKVVGVEDGKINVAWVHHGPAFGIDDPEYHHQEVKGQPYKHNGLEYQYTDAHYQYGINDAEGVILALNLKGPEHVVDWPKAALPALRRSSDIMYGLWSAYRESQPLDTLRYVMVVQITNEKTKGLIVRAVGENVIDAWPGVFIGVGETGNEDSRALALLGAPVSAPVAYMLIQHKDAFKELRIVGVRAFLTSDRIRKACLLWYIKGPGPVPPGWQGMDGNIWGNMSSTEV